MDGNDGASVAQTGHFKVYYRDGEGIRVNTLAILFRLKLLPAAAPWSIRLPSAVAGVLTVLGVYFLAGSLFGDAAGLLAAFFLATSFWHVNFSRIGFRAIFVPLFLVWAIYFLLKAFESASSRNGWIYGALGGIVYGLGFYTYIAYRVTPLIVLVFMLLFIHHPGFWRRSVAFMGSAFIFALPIGLFFVKYPSLFFARIAQVSITNNQNAALLFADNVRKIALQFNFGGDKNWRHNISGAPQLSWPVGILFVAGLMLVVSWMWKRWRRKEPGGFSDSISCPSGTILCCAWLILGAIPAVVSEPISVPHAVRSILMVVPATILAALAGIWLYRWLSDLFDKRPMQIATAIFILSTTILSYRDYFVVWAKNPNVSRAFCTDLVDIGNAINALPPNVEKYVVVEWGTTLWPAETVMFVTQSYAPTAQSQKEVRNIHYLLPNETQQIPSGTSPNTIFYIK